MGFDSLKKDKNKKNSRFKLEKLNETIKLNRLKKVISTNYKKLIKFNGSAKVGSGLKSAKNLIFNISNKIDDLILINKDKDNKNKIIVNKANNSNVKDNKNKISSVKRNNSKEKDNKNKTSGVRANNSKEKDNKNKTTGNNANNSKNKIKNEKYLQNNSNVYKNNQDKNLKNYNNDFINKIEEDFDDEYYRRIEPTKDEIKYENYLKSLDRNNFKNLNSNDNEFINNNKNNIDNDIVLSKYNTGKSRDSLENKHELINSDPLNDKLGNLNGMKKENTEKLDFRDVFKLDKNLIKKFKDSISKDDDSKTIFGAAIFGLILIVILFSTYYFLFYQPYQEDLSTAKNNKLNELNSLFKGPLALDSNVLTLNSEIDLATSPEEVNTIDIIRPATASWRDYQSKQINNTKDDFNRVMISYETGSIENNSSTSPNGGNKNIIMYTEDAQSFVNENDVIVLANIVFKKPDTVAVPILISRLQAGAGLISTGSIVDIYFLADYSSQSQSSDSSSYDSNSDSSTNGSDVGSNGTNESSIDNNENGKNQEPNQQKLSNLQSSSQTYSPDISGSTVLAIMRSKDSGVITADYFKSQTTINGNNTNQAQNSKSFSTNVEEMIRGSVSGGYDEKRISSLLNSYGLKLSNYERQSNLAELDVQYLLLIEVPRDNVPYLINNMEDIILTIPTSEAPNWLVNELKSTYLKK